MRVLFTILLVAIAGLVWATVAAAQHIRRTRRQNRQAHAQEQIGGSGLPAGSALPPFPPPPPGEHTVGRTASPRFS